MRRRFLLQYSIGGFITAEAAAESGIDIRDPTSDYRVVRFTVQVSPDVARGPMRRWPIRQAMKGLLPDAVRLNTAGGIQAADLVTRLRSQRKEIEEALVTCEAVPLVHEYLDVSRMRRAFARVLSVDDVWSTRLASEVVLRGLGIGFFLKKLN
jgi:asparagine synthase (glutamine-hydrolysing)